MRFRIVVALSVLVPLSLISVVWGIAQLWTSHGSESAPSAEPSPPAQRILVFGDSWTYGSSASSVEKSYGAVLADVLGADAVIDGVRGSGYLQTGIDGGDYGTRIAALDPALDPALVIVQGSINDRFAGEQGYPDAVNAAWDRLAGLYPDARIVVFGPAPQEFPVFAGTERIDHDLAELAEERGWQYVSPLSEKWIREDNYAGIIDAETLHPSDSGHIFLAVKLAAALRECETEGEESAECREQ